MNSCFLGWRESEPAGRGRRHAHFSFSLSFRSRSAAREVFVVVERITDRERETHPTAFAPWGPLCTADDDDDYSLPQCLLNACLRYERGS